jgi:hypothetical protein
MKLVLQIALVTLVVLEIVWGISVVYGVSDGAWSVLNSIAFFHGGIAFGVIGLVWFVVAVRRALREHGRCIGWHLLSRSILFQPLLLGLVFVLAFFGVAFRARFEISRPALERYVKAITEKQFRQSKVEWIGALRVTEVDRAGDSVRFITGPCMFDDCGIAYSASGVEPQRVGEDTYVRISETWWHWRRSW